MLLNKLNPLTIKSTVHKYFGGVLVFIYYYPKPSPCLEFN